MKKIITLIAFALFAMTSCSDDGERGPQGPQGPPGEDGLDGLGYTFEQTVSFEYFSDLNLYSAFITIPDEIETINHNADAVLVYLLGVVEGNNGGEIDTWSLIPQNFFLDDGTIQYVYNHTPGDVEIIIDGNFDLSTLDSGFTEGQTFRVVVVPSDIISASGVDVSNYEAVMKAIDVQEKEILVY